MNEIGDVLERLQRTLEQRNQTRPENSYTTKLLEGGGERIGAKVLEEAGEVCEAAQEPGAEGRAHFVYEAGDLLYHLAVLLVWRGVSLEEVADELARREGTSGLDEKRSRQHDSQPRDIS